MRIQFLLPENTHINTANTATPATPEVTTAHADAVRLSSKRCTSHSITDAAATAAGTERSSACSNALGDGAPSSERDRMLSSTAATVCDAPYPIAKAAARSLDGSTADSTTIVATPITAARIISDDALRTSPIAKSTRIITNDTP